MNNPLNRSMFRKKAMEQAGPQGIMASGPELMTAVQRAKAKKRPVRAQTGVSVNMNPRSLSNEQLVQLVQGQIADARRGPQAAGAQARIYDTIGEAVGAVRPAPRLASRLELEALERRQQAAVQDALTSQIGAGGPFSLLREASGLPQAGPQGFMADRVARPRVALPTAETRVPTGDGILDTEVGRAVKETAEGTPRAGEPEVTEPPTQSEVQGPPVPTAAQMAQNLSVKYGRGDDSSVNAGSAMDGLQRVTAPEGGEAPKLKRAQKPAGADKKAGPDTKPGDIAKNFDAVNKIDPKLSRKERVEKRLELYKDILGEEKVNDLRTDKAYATFMTGLLIAGGTDPNAVKNIADGTAQGVSMFAEAVGEERKTKAQLDREAKLAAIAGVESDIATEEAREFQTSEREQTQKFSALENAKERALRENLQLRQIESNESIAQLGTDTQVFLTDQRQKFDAEIANANNANEILAIQERGRLQVELAEMGFKFDADKLAITLKAAEEQDLSAADLRRELAKIPTTTAQLIEKYVPADEIPTILTASEDKKKIPTDTQYAYNRLTKQGMSEADAVIFSNSSAVSAMISDLGVDGFNELLNTKLTKRDTAIPEYSEAPSDAELERLVTSGTSQIRVGGQLQNITPQG